MGVTRHLNLFPYWPHELLIGDVKERRDGGVTSRATPVYSGSGPTECATLMDPLTPYCGAALQSSLADLTPPPSLICPSQKDKTDQLDLSPSNPPIMADRRQKRGERIEKCAREK